MKYSQAKQGRVFVVRLEDAEVLHEVIEEFAASHNISCAALIIIGGAREDSRLVVGPQDGDAAPVVPTEYILDNVHEIVGTGTIFPDEDGRPILHMHISSGRSNSTITGCVRSGVIIWQVAEVIVFELIQTTAIRKFDPKTGFKLLRP